LFSIFKKKEPFFTVEETTLIVQSIRQAEQRTSGEVRVFVETKCSWVDALDRASEIFYNLKMDKTALRNATLIYVAMKDRQVAVFGDENINQKVGAGYWSKLTDEMIDQFNHQDYAKGIIACVQQIGTALTKHFPFEKSTDKNELPDEIVFGK
jgi:uncharacterized membrane protein